MRLLTPEAVAEQLAVSRSTVLRLIGDGSLACVCLRRGKRKAVYRIRQEVLDRWVISKERAAKTPSTTAPQAEHFKPANGQAPV